MKLMIAVLLSVFFTSAVFAGSAPLKMQQVVSGLYVHFGVHELPDQDNHGAIANIGFIVGSQCVAVIDSGGNPQQGYALKNAIRAVTSLPICYVINTHVHPDHIFGNRAFKKTGAKFVGHYRLPRAMALRGSFYSQRSVEQIGIKLTNQDMLAPDIVVKKEVTLDLGNRKIILTAHPTAHTDNDLSIYDVNSDSLWLADLLFITHIPVIDGSLNGWLSELTRLEKQSFRRVIPGHGPLVTDWPQAMQAQKVYLQLLRDEIRTAIKQGVYLEDAVNTVGLSNNKQWQLFAQLHKKNVTTAFAELEWED